MSTTQMPEACQIESLMRQVRLSQATTLARAGSHQAAEALLAGELGSGGEDAPILDLLARIKGQQGDLFEASSLWQRVMRIDPSHAGAIAGLQRIRSMQRPSYRAPALYAFGLVLAVLSVAGLIVASKPRGASVADALAPLQRSEAAKQAELRSQIGGLASGLNATTGQLSQLSASVHQLLLARAAPPATVLQFKLDIPGVVTSVTHTETVVAFRQPLFRRGAQFEGGARTKLRAIAKAVRASATPLQVKIVGLAGSARAVPTERDQERVALALERAATVASFLARPGLLHSAQLSASCDEAVRPFPTGGVQFRTVVLRITPDQPMP